MAHGIEELLNGVAPRAQRGVPSAETSAEATALHRAVLELAGDYVLLVGAASDGAPVVIGASEGALSMLGYSRDELSGRLLATIDPQASPDGFRETVAALRDEGTKVIEGTHIRKDGSRFDVENRLRLVTLSGQPVIVSVERDITARTMGRARLRHSNALLRYIIAHARSAIAVHDRDLKYVYVSERYLRDYGVREQDVIGKHHYEVFPDLPRKWREVHQRALRGEICSAEEDLWERPDGSQVWTQWECRPWFDEGGAIGGIVVYTEVITDRVLTQTRLRESERNLRKAHHVARLNQWVFDAVTDTIWSSGELADVYDLPASGRRSEMLERCLRAVHPDDRERVRELMRNRDPATLAGAVECRSIRRDGSVGYLLAIPGEREVDAEGRLLRLTGIVQDVTELRQSQEEKKRLESQLQQAMKMEAVGRLAGGVAHDFNNLLTPIMANVDLAKADLPDGHPARPLLDEVGQAAESAAALTRQLLAFSRKQVIEPRVLDLDALIANVHKMLVRLIGEDILLQIKTGPRARPVNLDVGQFEQVLANLAVNARDAMPGGGRLVIETANIDLDETYCATHPGATPGPYVMLAVSDTGQGMSDEVKRHLFEPFFTTKPKGRGTGLGLATTFGAVKQAGGTIDVYSELGKGTTVRMYLPAVNAPLGELEDHGSDADLVGGSETVLLVEDDPGVRRSALRILQRLGYRVLHASNGVEALAIVEQQRTRVDLLVTDVVMPDMNGRQLADRVAGLQPAVKVLYTSGYTEDVIVHHGIVDESLSFIAKPYTASALARKIRVTLGDRQRP